MLGSEEALSPNVVESAIILRKPWDCSPRSTGVIMPERKCVFCGELFTGQKHNFEHVIPQWLVREADLAKRSAPVDFPDRKFDAAMSRIGGRACEKCNEASSRLEGLARTAYVKIRDGAELSPVDGQALLDWLDKLRVGMWLWAIEVGKNAYSISPKFHINERMAYRDRLLLAAKYPAGPPMKGLAIWGATECFMWSPTCIGFVINNIVLVSISSNFLVSRHLAKLDLKRQVDDAGDENVDVALGTDPGSRLEFFAAPFVLGQVILPDHLFKQLGLKMEAPSDLHAGWGNGPVLRLNGKLEELGRLPAAVPLFTGNRDAHATLMEMYLENTTKFLLNDLLKSDMSTVVDVEHREAMIARIHEYLERTEVDISQLAITYKGMTGLKLPT